MKYVQLICGPAGSGKTTYVTALSHLIQQGSLRRTIHCANLDPGCDSYTYDAAFDVRELIGVEDVMEEVRSGRARPIESRETCETGILGSF